MKTKFQRQIIRGSWFYQHDSGAPFPYPESAATDLEMAWQRLANGGTQSIEVPVGDDRFVILNPGQTVHKQFRRRGMISRDVYRGWPSGSVAQQEIEVTTTTTVQQQQPQVVQQTMMATPPTAVMQTPVMTMQPQMTAMSQPQMMQPQMTMQPQMNMTPPMGMQMGGMQGGMMMQPQMMQPQMTMQPQMMQPQMQMGGMQGGMMMQPQMMQPQMQPQMGGMMYTSGGPAFQ